MRLGENAEDHDELLGQLLDEFLERATRGERPDIEEYAARYPELAGVLRHGVSALQMIADADPSADSTATVRQPPPNDFLVSRELGDFRIRRQIGRGGMGVVYEAEQLSVGRTVALKVLPFAALADEQAIKRFHNEARAAATLDHPHIVAIYGVGEDRGVHYYAMRYVEGRSLAAVIENLRQQRRSGKLDGSSIADSAHEDVASLSHIVDDQPLECSDAKHAGAVPTNEHATPSRTHREFYRSLARLGARAAEALHYAHEQGIVHRDIKPANLLLDKRGDVFITDFGLAHMDSVVGLTMSGDVLGTLRYMAPEQALGKRSVVDARCDIYSLAVTLYELLLQRAAHSGDDRVSLLRQIAFESPPRPRQLDPSVPHDLQTVILKGMEKDIDQRYSTALEFAEELQRFYDDQPIRIRPPTIIERVQRWARHHTRFVLGVSVCLAVASLSAALALAVVGRSLRDTRQAERNAVRAQQHAEASRNKEMYQRYVARMRLGHHEWSSGNLLAASQVLDDFSTTATRGVDRNWEWHYLRSLCHRDEMALSGHTAPVHFVAWSPDGSRIASRSSDDTVRFWDAANTGASVVFHGPGNELSSIAWLPDSKSAAIVCGDQIRIVNAVTAEDVSVRTIESSLRFGDWSPDGKRLAGLSQVGDRLVVFDTAIPGLLWEVDVAQRDVGHLAWSPDGSRLATIGGALQSEICIWDAATGHEIRSKLQAHGHIIRALEWSRDGARLVTGGFDQVIKIWNAESLELERELNGHDGVVQCLKWNPHDQTIASGGSDGLIRIWDSTTGKERAAIRGHLGPVETIDWSPDGHHLVSGALDCLIKVWDTRKNQEVHVTAGRAQSWSPDGRCFAVSHYLSDDPRSVPASHRTVDIYAYLDGESKRIQRLDTGLREVFVPDCEWNASGTKLAAAVSAIDGNVPQDGQQWIIVWDVASGRELMRLRAHKRETRSIEWSPDGERFATSGLDGEVNIWNATDGQLITRLKPGSHLVGSLAWNPDGTRLAAATWDGPIKIWDTVSWRMVMTYNRPHTAGTSRAGNNSVLDWNADGRLLFAGTPGGWVVGWDTVSGKEVQRFPAHTANVRCIDLSPDGRRLITGSEDNTVRVWDVETGALLVMLTPPLPEGWPRIVGALKWSPDGRKILAGIGNYSFVWDATKSYEMRDQTVSQTRR